LKGDHGSRDISHNLVSSSIVPMNQLKSFSTIR
jgi:hypothetical protein